jgi:hypothetical protein
VERTAVGIVVGPAYVDAGIVPVAAGSVASAAVVDTAVLSATVVGGTEIVFEAVLGIGAGVAVAGMPGAAVVVTVVVVAGTVQRRAVGQLPGRHPSATIVAMGPVVREIHVVALVLRTVDPAVVGPGER